MLSETHRKVLLIGWDAADWDIIQPLADKGLMPNISKLLENGSMGNLKTIQPPFSPMLWTSIATGKRPYKHGIFGFLEPSEDRTSVVPISNIGRKSKALWNILHQNGKRSLVVGWWPSHPAEPINGVMVSDLFYDISGKPSADWPLVKGSCWPESFSELLGELRVHPSDLTFEDLRPFMPNIERIHSSDSQLDGVCAKFLCEATTIQSIATELMETQPWDLAAIYFNAIDHFCHSFIRYHPPKLDWISDEDFANYSNVVSMCYQYHDMMLGRLMDLAGEDCYTLVVSDHGFQSQHLRVSEIPNEAAGPAAEHREFGIFVAAGSGIKKDSLIHGASILDVTPTVLELFGLPIGKDMDGRVLTEIFERPGEQRTVDSWDLIEGDAGLHSTQTKINNHSSVSSVEQLIELGYVDPSIKTCEDPCTMIERENLYNKGLSLMGGNQFMDAANVFIDLSHQDPADVRFLIKLALCLDSLGRYDQMEVVVNHLEDTWNVLQRVAAEKTLELYHHLKSVADSQGVVVSKPAAILNDIAISEEDYKLARNLLSMGKINAHTIQSLKASIAAARGDFATSTKCLLDDLTAPPMVRSKLLLQHGVGLIAIDQLTKARQVIEESLKINPDNEIAMLNMGRVFLRKRKPLVALEWFNKAVGSRYFFPEAHFFRGMALSRANETAKGIDAILLAIHQHPEFPQAHKLLSRLYETCDDFERSAKHIQLYEQTRSRIKKEKASELVIQLPSIDVDAIRRKLDMQRNGLTFNPVNLLKGPYGLPVHPEPIVIVSGLPRSGTSAMMQMLVAAGLVPCTDQDRPADDNNPKGYLEYKKTLRLFEDNSWLADARNKVIKIIAPLLPFVPQGENYRIILMRRDMEEILDSQTKMLQRLNPNSSRKDRQELRIAYQLHFDKVLEVCDTHHIPIEIIDFSDLIHSPADVANKLCSFIGKSTEVVHSMVETVDPTLYRERRKKAFE